jgi:hypothetical protein
VQVKWNVEATEEIHWLGVEWRDAIKYQGYPETKTLSLFFFSFL